MYMTTEEALERVSERVVLNTKDIKQKNRQRRHNFVDMYGVEYTRQGDGGSPATFYVSISPDMVYLERFEFKLIVQPFITTVSGDGVQSATVKVNDTSLRVTENNNNHTVTPNPHDHTTEPHTHNIVNGITMIPTTANDFRITVSDPLTGEEAEITEYLAAQFDEWIDGEGVYPNLVIGQNYDILAVASDMVAEGRDSDADLLTRSGYKGIKISSSSPFQVTLVNYLKYSHMNR